MTNLANHRWVCGALGRWDSREYQRLRERIGAPVDPIFESRDAILHARGDLTSWLGSDGKGWSWGPPFSHPPIRTWREAVAAPTGAGLWVGPRETVLYADASGVVPVFIYRGDRHLLFSTSVDALATSLNRRLHVDWAAWSEILSSMSVLGKRTPFEEISRLGPSTIATSRRGRIDVRELSWPWAEAVTVPTGDEEEAVDEIIETVTEAVHSIASDRLVVPLSGGWDSRFLATVATRDSRQIRTVTVPPEFGRDEEIEWARAVAGSLDLRHDILPRAVWESSFQRVAERVDRLTSMHFWLWPLAEWLRGCDDVVLDGLAGDVLIKNLFVPREALEGDQPPPKVLAAGLSASLDSGELLAAPVAASVRSHIDQIFVDEWERWAEHLAAPTLVVYRMRTLGGIAPSPMMLLGSAAVVATPFVGPEVVRAALSVAPRAKLDGRLYRQVIARLGEHVAGIPSTNDTKPGNQGGTNPLFDEAAVTLVVKRLEHDAVAPLLGSFLDRGPASEAVRRAIATRDGRRVISGLVLFAEWVERYQERLRDADQPPWVPSTPRLSFPLTRKWRAWRTQGGPSPREHDRPRPQALG